MKGVFNASVFMGRPLYPADITTTVSVYNAETDELVPTLWLDRDGTDELANPHPLSEDGVILFYVDPGRYNIVVEKGTQLYREWPDVIISDAATSGTPGIQSVVAGTNVTVDDTDPLNPVVSATGGGGIESIVAGTNIAVDDTDPANPVVSSTAGDRRAVTALTSSSGIVTIDYSLGDYFTLEPTENIGGFIITNPPTDGACIGIEITQGATPRTVVFGAEYQFTASSPLDTVPSGAGEKALLFMTTFNGGFTWWLTMDTLA